jgi:hypothetical protein
VALAAQARRKAHSGLGQDRFRGRPRRCRAGSALRCHGCDHEAVAHDHHIGEQLLRLVVEELPPEEVPRLATDALEQGCEAKSVAALAGLRSPTRAEVLDLLPAFLQELDLMPSQSEALKAVIDEVARKIVAGTLAPCIGATILWGYSHDREFGGEAWKQLMEFEAAADGCEESLIVSRGGDGRLRRDPVSLYDEDIVQAASAFLASGGLHDGS